jgi:hypothetical protein
MTGTKLSFIISSQSPLYFSVTEHYGLRNTTCWSSKDVASVLYSLYVQTTINQSNVLMFRPQSIMFCILFMFRPQLINQMFRPQLINQMFRPQLINQLFRPQLFNQMFRPQLINQMFRPSSTYNIANQPSSRSTPSGSLNSFPTTK